MARYSSEHKEETRRRIVDCAGRRFKRDGIDGAGIAALMSDASLTNGAFYAHFTSKEDLVCAVLTDQVRRQRESYGAQPFTREAFEQFARAYLSSAHRDDHEGGCPSAALLDDVIRSGPSARHSYTSAMIPLVDDLAAVFPSDDARSRAASIFASMVGTLQLARAVDDPDLASDILRHGLDNVLGLLELHGSATGEGSTQATNDVSRS